MPLEVVMPALSPEMEEGLIVRWLVEPGARVNKGDLLAEIETVKATVELEAEASGVIDEILAQAGGDPVAVGVPIVRIRTD